MAIVKWNRWNPIYPSFFNDEDFFSSNILENNSGIDIYETDESVVVEAQVPGIEEKDVHVTVEDNILTISAEHTEVKEEKEKKTMFDKQRKLLDTVAALKRRDLTQRQYNQLL